MSPHGVRLDGAGAAVSAVNTRRVFLTREGQVFRLAFRYDPALVERVKGLHYATFDDATRTWTVAVCAQNLDALRAMFYDGLCDVTPDSLLAPGETPPPARDAVLRAGTLKRPFVVVCATRNDHLFTRLKSIPGGVWEKNARGLSFGPQAAAALGELVDRGVVDDPARLLSPAALTVAFDGRTGRFVVRGDHRAQAAFDRHFPGRDIVAAWAGRGFDVAFADEFSAQMYRGELARHGAGYQPAGLAVPLYPYQAQALAVALERPGLALFLEMGLGKTPVAIAYGYELVVNRGEAPRTVAVVPAAIRTQWANEITRFTGCDDIVVVDGDKKRRLAAYETAADARWLILPFSETLSRDYAHIAPLVAGAVLIADESHRIKNHAAKRTKTMRQLAGRAGRRLALTGTPVESAPGEIYNIVSGFAVPGCLGSVTDWLNRYSYPNRWGGFEGARNLGELRERVRPFYVRYTKRDVAEHLPPLRVHSRVLDPDPAYAALLRRIHRDARDEIRDAATRRAARAGRANGVLDGVLFDEVENAADMTAVGMLRLLCSSPRLLLDSDAPAARALVDAGLVPDEDGPKLDQLRLAAAELAAAGERVVVFTFSKRMAALISERFTADGIAHVTFTGDTSSRDRDAAVAAFCAPPTPQNPGPTAFVATDAGGEGLNLAAQCATLINVDLPWTPGVLAQRSARVHRIAGGVATDRVLVENYVLTGTLETGILKLLERRADLQDAIFGESGGRRRTTGRQGRSVFEEALGAWAA